MAQFSDLLKGYRRFRTSDWAHQHERWAELRDQQAPRVMVIACSDSRVDPAQIFDTSPGEIFVVRNVANLVPPFEVDSGRHGVSAALEFAVTQLDVEEIVVLGHGRCGGCAAALRQDFKGTKPGEGGFIAHWIDLLDDIRAEVIAAHDDLGSDAALRAMEHAAVKVSLSNLATFPFVRERLAAGRLTIHGAYFAITDGRLHLLDRSGVFAAVPI